MKLLVVFLLAVLSCSFTEAKVLSKCELRDQLKTAIGNLTLNAQPQGVTVDDLVAKIVCHAELASGFNTSAVNQVVEKKVSYSGKWTELYQISLEKDGYTGGQKGRAQGPRNGKWPSLQIRPTHRVQNCMLYGVFQLSSCKVCNNSVTPTTNICGIPCSNLLGDDISDDISCLLKILPNPGDSGVGMKLWEELAGRFRPTSENKCEDVQASVYFAGCS